MSRSFLSRLSKNLLKVKAEHIEFKKLLSTTSILRNETTEQNTHEDTSVVVEKMEDFKIVCIGINRPAKRNCVNKSTANKLYDAFSDFENDDNLNCAVLHGNISSSSLFFTQPH